MTLATCRRWLCAELGNSTSEADLLLVRSLGESWGQLMLQPDRPLSAREIDKIRQVLAERMTGKPLAYIFNIQDFYGEPFYVDEGVLIPRPETEILVEKALAKINEGHVYHVADLGCGSGCIGLTIAKHRPLAKVLLIDKSPAAIRVASINQHKLAVGECVQLRCQVINDQQPVLPAEFSPLHFIVANPPYIAEGDPRVHPEVIKFEPHMALFAANEGMEWFHKWLHWSYDNLVGQGLAFFEFGSGQSEKVLNLAKARGFEIVEVVKDYQQLERILIVRKPNG